MLRKLDGNLLLLLQHSLSVFFHLFLLLLHEPLLSLSQLLLPVENKDAKLQTVSWQSVFRWSQIRGAEGKQGSNIGAHCHLLGRKHTTLFVKLKICLCQLLFTCLNFILRFYHLSFEFKRACTRGNVNEKVTNNFTKAKTISDENSEHSEKNDDSLFMLLQQSMFFDKNFFSNLKCGTVSSLCSRTDSDD